MPPMPEALAGSCTSSALSVLRLAPPAARAACSPSLRAYSSILALAASMASGATRHSAPLGGLPARLVPSLSRALTCESASVMQGDYGGQGLTVRPKEAPRRPAAPARRRAAVLSGTCAIRGRMPGTLLVALDFSAVGRAALDAAIALAKDLRARLVLVHAFQRAFMAPELAPGAAARVADREGRLEESDAIDLSTAWAGHAREAGLTVATETMEGDPATSVVEAARRHGATLIVVGTHGRTGVRRLVLGSTAEAIVRHSDRPVLVVPHKG